VGHPIELSEQFTTGDRFMGIRLLGTLVLNGDPALAELSDLAWDADEGILYGITDRGQLLHLRPRFEQGRLVGCELLASHALRNAKGKRLRKYRRDAEGLALEHGRNGIRGDSQLLVSFEGQHRLVRYSTSGRYINKLKRPAPLRDSRLFTGKNKGLEALTLHPTLGLMTGPERLRDDQPIPLFNARGDKWLYQPFEHKGSLVALEALPDGELLVLERAFDFPFIPWVITLSHIQPTKENRNQVLTARVVARFDSGEGWVINNFEGLTRTQGNRFFMVSDNGGMQLLPTQLLYFELLP